MLKMRITNSKPTKQAERCQTLLMYMNEQELIPKNKFDLDAAKRLLEATPEQVSVVAFSLLEWIEDMNWPVALEIIHVLPKFYKELLPSIEQILTQVSQVI